MTSHSIALVTGGNRGIGLACAQALAVRGFKVAVTGRDRKALDEAVATLSGSGHMAQPADITRADDVDTLFEAIEGTYGRLDFLFNNAGRNAPQADPGELSVEDWNAIVATNLTGSFLCARAAFALMKRQDPRGGRIVNNGSISAHVPRPKSIAYAATKHAVTGLTRSLSLDGRPYDIACGQIDIGNAASEMTEQMAEGVPQADGSKRPEPVMDRQAVADSVVHMASLPLSANVQFMTVLATKMPYIGRG